MDALTDHNGCAVSPEVHGQISSLGGQLLARGHGEKLALHPAGLGDDESDLSGPDPLLGVQEALVLVSHVNKDLLDLSVRGDGGGGVTLVSIGRNRGRIINTSAFISTGYHFPKLKGTRFLAKLN